MRWNCPHCKADLSLSDALLTGGWSISRCSSCQGHALMKAAEVSLIKLDRVPENEPILLAEPAAGVPLRPIVRQAAPRAKAPEPLPPTVPLAQIAPKPLAIPAAAFTTAPRQITTAVESSPWSPPSLKRNIALPSRPASFSPPPAPPKAVLMALAAAREQERAATAIIKSPAKIELKPVIQPRELTPSDELAFLSDTNDVVDPTLITEPTSSTPALKRSRYLPAFASLLFGLSLLGAHSFFTRALRSAEIAQAPARTAVQPGGTISAPILIAREDSAPVPPAAILPVIDQVHLAAMLPVREPVIAPARAILIETITDKVYLRSGPSQKFRRLGFARNDFRYSVTGRSEEWLKVEIPGQPGPSAWIHRDFVRAVTN